MSSIKISEAEARVAHLVSLGLTNEEVARTLNLRRKTIKNHLNAIYSRGGVTNRNELIHAHQEGRLGTSTKRS